MKLEQEKQILSMDQMNEMNELSVNYRINNIKSSNGKNYEMTPILYKGDKGNGILDKFFITVKFDINGGHSSLSNKKFVISLNDLVQQGYLNEKDIQGLNNLVEKVESVENDINKVANIILGYLVKEKGLDLVIQQLFQDKVERIDRILSADSSELYELAGIVQTNDEKKLAEYNQIIKNVFGEDYIVFYDGKLKVIYNKQTGQKIGSGLAFFDNLDSLLENLTGLEDYISVENDYEKIKEITKQFGAGNNILGMKYETFLGKTKKLLNEYNEAIQNNVPAIFFITGSKGKKDFGIIRLDKGIVL